MRISLLLTIVFIATTSLFANQRGEFEIKLKAKTFTPEVTVNFEEAITAQPTEKDLEYIYRLIQFYAIPTTSEKQKIHDAGIELLSYIPNKAFFAKIPRGLSTANFDDLKIRSIVPIEAEYKLSPELTKDESKASGLVGDDLQLHVKFYSKNEEANLVQFVLANQGLILGRLEKVNMLVVQLSATKLNMLSKHPLIQWIEPVSVPTTPDDAIANGSTRTNALNSSYNGGRKYDGSGVVVALSDQGEIGPHIDFTGRFTHQTNRNTGNHSDMTGGILAGAGNLDPTIGGIAPGAHLQVYRHGANDGGTFFTDYLYIVDAVQNMNTLGTVITSTSWGERGDGDYNTAAEFVDQQLNENRSLMHVQSAGNEGTRDKGYGAGAGWGNISGGTKAGKNILCIGNLTSDDDLVTSSSRGPAVDGRIKPDLCAQGNGTLTTDENNTFQVGGGTSASTPVIAGIVAQLYQAYKELNGGVNPETGLLKASLLNTCEDLGNPGPDFKFGWGRVNALKAVRILEDRRYIRDSIGQSEDNTHIIAVPAGVSQVRIMTYWTDVSGNPVSGIGLVNDLDMTVTRPNGDVHNPWVLDPTPDPVNLDADAVQGIDRLNNVEQVTIDNPVAGNYTVDLNGFAIPEGPQVYYVVYDFIMEGVELTYPLGGESFVPRTTEVIRWDASPSSEEFTVAFSLDGGNNYFDIATSIPSTSRSYEWSVPGFLRSDVKLRVTRGSSSSESLQTFVIAEVPENISIVRVCPDAIEIEWDPVDDVELYEISVLGEKYMDSIGVTSNNRFEITGLHPNDEHWFSVRSIVSGEKGRRAIAINQPGGTQNCMLSNDVATVEHLYPIQGVLNECVVSENTDVIVKITNIGSQATTDVELNYQINGGTIVTEVLSAIAPGESIDYTFLTQADISSIGSYEIATWSTWAIDENTFNDTIITMTKVVGSELISSFPYVQTFQSFTNCSTAPTCELITCDLFEGWTNINDPNFDDIDWRTNSEETNTSNTGPTTDYDNGTSDGKYLYLEGTEGCNFRDASLLSPCIDLTLSDTAFVEFAYHMFGSNTGELHVDIITGAGEFIDVVSPIIGNQGDSWNLLTVDLTPYSGEIINLRIRGSIGNGTRSDIAIDAVSITAPISVSSDDLNELTDNIQIFPNPTSGHFNIQFPSHLTTQQVNIKLVNTLGTTVLELENTGTTESISLGNSDITSGVYYVLISSENFEIARKVIKQ